MRGYRLHRPEFPPEALATPGVDATLDDVKRWHLARIVTLVDGNQKRAAERLHISRSALRDALVRYGYLKRPHPVTDPSAPALDPLTSE